MPTLVFASLCGALGALLMIGTVMAFWLIIVPLPNPSAQDWRHFVSNIVGWFFPTFWTSALYFVAILIASVFVPRKAIEGRVGTTCLFVYLTYAEIGFWSFSCMRNVNPDGASIMAFNLLNPLVYPVTIFISLLSAILICFVRQITAWGNSEWKRVVVGLPLLVLVLGAPLLISGGSFEKGFSEIWLKLDGGERH